MEVWFGGVREEVGQSWTGVEVVCKGGLWATRRRGRRDGGETADRRILVY